jgi:SAM-dependent methyltransferase
MATDYDLALFERLNKEFEARPLKPTPVRHDVKSMQEKAERRITTISRQLEADFQDKEVLELGCGHGWLTAYLPSRAGASRAIGVDVRRYSAWDQHDDPRASFLVADMAVEDIVPDDSVDYVLSGAVMEHVERPVEMLESIHRALRPGGRAWLYFNLYRGPQASHRYNEVNFPWPHLLFDDDVCEEYYARHNERRGVRFAWVNRMTLAHYVLACHEIGFAIVGVRRRVTPIDLGFYVRFRDKLSRYPALDLETDFATLVLEKGTEPGPLPELGYLERERELASQLAGIPDAS